MEFAFNFIFSASDCNFENGFGGCHNYEDIFLPFRGQWFVYDCSTSEYNSFYGLQRDVNFPFTNGVYTF